MDSDALRQAIEELAWLVGLEFEQGLVATILEDVEGQPGVLPLLEHSLLELWERRRAGMLTLEAYLLKIVSARRAMRQTRRDFPMHEAAFVK